MTMPFPFVHAWQSSSLSEMIVPSIVGLSVCSGYAVSIGSAVDSGRLVAIPPAEIPPAGDSVATAALPEQLVGGSELISQMPVAIKSCAELTRA